MKMSEIILKIDEISQRHVGKGIAVIDPKVVKDNKWQAGQIVELLANKKTHVKIWPSTADDFSTDRKSTRLNSSHIQKSRMPSSA